MLQSNKFYNAIIDYVCRFKYFYKLYHLVYEEELTSICNFLYSIHSSNQTPLNKITHEENYLNVVLSFYLVGSEI